MFALLLTDYMFQCACGGEEDGTNFCMLSDVHQTFSRLNIFPCSIRKSKRAPPITSSEFHFKSITHAYSVL